MNTLEQLVKQISDIETKIGYIFQNKELLILAFVHRSYYNEQRQFLKEHNERLEFLGDAVLGLLIAEYLYKSLPSTPEGDLSTLRSKLVEAPSCVAYIQRLGVAQYLLLGKGEQRNSGRGRDTIHADLFEAIIGAIYLDGGLDMSRKFIFRNFTPEIDAILKRPLENWKAMLQDYAQRNYGHAPRYLLLSEAGPDHSKMFVIAVEINGRVVGQGEGASKKEAQQAAAAAAMLRLDGKEL